MLWSFLFCRFEFSGLKSMTSRGLEQDSRSNKNHAVQGPQGYKLVWATAPASSLGKSLLLSGWMAADSMLPATQIFYYMIIVRCILYIWFSVWYVFIQCDILYLYIILDIPFPANQPLSASSACQQRGCFKAWHLCSKHTHQVDFSAFPKGCILTFAIAPRRDSRTCRRRN